MVDAITAETPSAASPATDEAVRQAELLSGLTKLALEMARAFQAQGVAALAAGDADRAGKAVAGFNHLFLGIRRAVALKARLRRQRREEQDEADAAMLSELMELAAALARGVQAEGIAALAADDLDRAGTAETRFSSLFLGIRRAIALQARLQQQQEETRREAEDRRQDRQDETDGRRHAVAQGVTRAIAGAPGVDTDAKEQLTVDLWDRLTGDERIDADLADTALPIEALIASLCRALGLPPPPPTGGPPTGGPPAGGPAAGGSGAGRPGAAAKASAPATGPKASGPAPHRAGSNLSRAAPADDVGGPEGERRTHGIATGEVLDRNREPIPALPEDDRPLADTGPPDTPPPRDRRRWTDAERTGPRKTARDARWRRLHRLAQIQRHG
ncbi:MAG: hypothetical protein JF625_03320 [Inquilinus limosus]|uniref:Uncharacterized protein n=1 Tax=Inquilinus limosus TaxID=171674 RepID=A0A952KFT9_9PROT|nr:hypothetical protein [Inquilinus limosus]